MRNETDIKKIAEALGEGYVEEVETMTDEELKSISDSLKDNKSETSEKVLDLPSNNSILKMAPEGYMDSINESKKEFADKAIESTLVTDPMTGKVAVLDNDFDDMLADASLNDILDDTIPENIAKSKSILKDNLNIDLSEENLLELLAFIRKVEDGKVPKIYPELPLVIKDIIDDTTKMTPDMQTKEFMAREFYSMIRRELLIDSEFIELEKAIAKEMDIPNIMDMYLDHITETMEVNIYNKAVEIQETEPDKALQLFGMVDAFKDAYMYTTLKEKVSNKKGIINKELTKDLKRYDKLCSKFNAKYKSSKYVMTDIRTLIYILDRKLPNEIPMDSIKKFILLFIKISRNKEVENIADHTFMYYTAKLIEALDHIDSDETKMKDIIINNITEVINIIEE